MRAWRRHSRLTRLPFGDLMVKIIAGLGNPGARYRRTRHNLGFEVLDALAARLGTGFLREKHEGLLAEATHCGERLLLVKPQTFMNRSGNCLAAVARNKIDAPGRLLVVVDDVHLPLGRLRVRADGSAGGHNGLKSIIERLGTQDFPRLRLGVGDERDTGDLADHVLSKFRPDERADVEALREQAVEAALMWVSEGIERTMNAFN